MHAVIFESFRYLQSNVTAEAQTPSALTMPLTVRDGALVGFGMLFASGATIFYRRKQTLPFKARPA